MPGETVAVLASVTPNGLANLWKSLEEVVVVEVRSHSRLSGRCRMRHVEWVRLRCRESAYFSAVLIGRLGWCLIRH